MAQYLLAIDQGTTSSRALLFDQTLYCVAEQQQEFAQYFPQDGWVEHNPLEIFDSVLNCCRAVIAQAKLTVDDHCAIGISNQRETTIVWDRVTGQPIYNAIVWQDRRTALQCQALKSAETMVRAKTGLLLDPYFSATKIAWILEHITDARERAEHGELAFGTVDSYLIWCLTGGQRHVTDATNAARTLLFNIHTQCWDKELLKLFNIPTAILPVVLDNCAQFGDVAVDVLGHTASIAGCAGDQQAALIGQACFQAGMIKSTYGTGCFMVQNTGSACVQSSHHLISTVAYRFNGVPTYAIEGSIFIAGAAVQWLRDTMKLIKHSKDTEQLANSVADNGGVYLVPAFTGLGAPYWDPNARGAILGLTRDTSFAHITRAALEAVCYQSRDLLLAMIEDCALQLTSLRVDGGMVANNWLLQFLADILDVNIVRSAVIETSAMGAAYLAGLAIGVFKSLDDIASRWQQEQVFKPKMAKEQREHLYAGWLDAVRRIVNRP